MNRLAWTLLPLLFAAGCMGSSGPDGGETFCRFPTFVKRAQPLITRDDGNCDAAQAATFGGACNNFHWLGLIGDPFVRYKNGHYQMWFTSGERTGPSTWIAGIAYSESTDGLLWSDPKDLQRDTKLLVRPGTPGLDEFGVETVSVVEDPATGGDRLYYTGDRSESPDSVHVIALATTTDNQTSVKRSTPVLIGTLPWEGPVDSGAGTIGGVLEPSVLMEDGLWKVWYAAFGIEPGDTGYARIGYATSTDGLAWTKYPTPVFKAGTKPFEVNGVSHTDVIRDPSGKGYHLFYAGIGNDNVLRIGHAFSEDGIHWERNPNNPVVAGTAGAWDSKMAAGPSALFVNGALRLYYMGSTAADFTAPRKFGLAEAVCQ